MNNECEEDDYGPLADIIRLLEGISEKLDRNHATLKRGTDVWEKEKSSCAYL